METPIVFQGGRFEDERGILRFNNNFNAEEVKRIYFIQNHSLDFARAWQGHKIEKRWFSAVSGKFIIKVIAITNWEQPEKDSKTLSFEIDAAQSDILFVPSGYVSSIQAVEENSKLMVMSDYGLGEIKDDYRFPADYFIN